jgi:hypothetical protein
MHALDRIATELREVAAGLEPGCYDAADAVRLTKVAAEAERLCATIKLLLAKRATQTRVWIRDSGAATEEQWLATVSGCSEWAAREALATASRVAELPATEAKLRDGTLSLAQATQVSLAATADPSSEDGMLRSAERDGMRELTARKERVVNRVTDQEAAQRRAHERRHLRTWVRGVETHGAFSGPTTEVAALLDALEPLQRRAFDAARKDGQREPQQAYRFDALIALARGEVDETKQATKPTARVRVDIARLLDLPPESGQAGDVCEIPGVGPVPGSFARQVLSHGLLELVLHAGTGVRTIVTKTRHVPEALKIALEEKDQRCAVRGCDATQLLERHHKDPFGEHQITSYEILRRLCPRHHDLVTYDGHTIVEHDDGSITLRPPGHAGTTAGTTTLAAADTGEPDDRTHRRDAHAA